MQITPEPTPDEVAAILAAHEALWPKPVIVADEPAADTRWRFSGRWWLGASLREAPRR
ncbi:MAG: hypothetical protein KDB21_18760 [Acidimicrobiales bacterium]|nr:hypothetical protein [Acidimicrobiales bacterium]